MTAQTNKIPGSLIVLDGPDGCGKSTQANLLADWIKARSIETSAFRDPGTTVIGEKIRDILLDNAHTKMADSTEVMLYMAARVQLYFEMIAPALKERKCVIMDRWLSSTCAYQGHAGGFGIDKVLKIAADSLPAPFPDLTIILDVDQQISSTRLKPQLDRMEQKGAKYHEKVRQGFIEFAKQAPDTFVINASADIQTVHANVIKTVEKVLL
jgi:dTMP kinase